LCDKVLGETTTKISSPIFAVLIGVIVGALAGYVDTHNDEVQATVLVLVVGMAITGFASPKWSWLAALVAGSCILSAHLIARALGIPPLYPVQPNVFASLLALIPAMVGAIAGAAARKVVS
jgi:NO-binding membrane sensor protein with MHYT domain